MFLLFFDKYNMLFNNSTTKKHLYLKSVQMFFVSYVVVGLPFVLMLIDGR